jgi:hypothetical protein
METKENFTEKGSCRHNFWRCAGFGVLGILGFGAFLIVGGAVIMLLWNWLMPFLFHLTEITFWQAVGLALLARLLFGASHHRWHHCDKRGWMQSRGSFGHHAFHHWKFRGEKNENCRSNFGTWQYYDKYWEEEGEKAFHEYIKRKNESTGSSGENVV